MKFKIVFGGTTKDGERLFYLWGITVWVTCDTPTYQLITTLREGELSKYGLMIFDHGIHHSSPSRYTLGPLSGRLM